MVSRSRSGNDPAGVDKDNGKPAYGSWFGYIGDANYYLFMNHVTPTWDEKTP